MTQINNLDDDINIDELILQLNKTESLDFLEKVHEEFEMFYTKFKEQFVVNEGIETTDDEKLEMINATYITSIESLHNGLKYLEYSYLLILAINKVREEYSVEPNSLKATAMSLTNKFIESILANINTDINSEIAKLLTQMKEENYENS